MSVATVAPVLAGGGPGGGNPAVPSGPCGDRLLAFREGRAFRRFVVLLRNVTLNPVPARVQELHRMAADQVRLVGRLCEAGAGDAARRVEAALARECGGFESDGHAAWVEGIEEYLDTLPAPAVAGFDLAAYRDDLVAAVVGRAERVGGEVEHALPADLGRLYRLGDVVELGLFPHPSELDAFPHPEAGPVEGTPPPAGPDITTGGRVSAFGGRRGRERSGLTLAEPRPEPGERPWPASWYAELRDAWDAAGFAPEALARIPGVDGPCPAAPDERLAVVEAVAAAVEQSCGPQGSGPGGGEPPVPPQSGAGAEAQAAPAAPAGAMAVEPDTTEPQLRISRGRRRLTLYDGRHKRTKVLSSRKHLDLLRVAAETGFVSKAQVDQAKETTRGDRELPGPDSFGDMFGLLFEGRKGNIGGYKYIGPSSVVWED